ncbi:MAG: methyltransferase domain-containing protein [Clostridium sp.]|uniref:class I SAM-dependent methyltransferase n=1 Tax=Clostridium sp. TaxID=1506 RepID=UPI00302A47BB
MDVKGIDPWELLQKKITWEQLKYIHNKKVLDFGSGNGITADHFAINNEVIAIEPDEKMLQGRFAENHYKQINGDISELKNFDDESFDVILCHNVLEYAEEREEIIKEFSRILKRKGCLSILKHNRAGRVMQMVVLLNNFDHAIELLEGQSGHAEHFGDINCYEGEDLLKWSDKFEVKKELGIRVFWHLQQNQDIQNDEVWQQKMIDMELKVSEIAEYKGIAMFHHIVLRKM